MHDPNVVAFEIRRPWPHRSRSTKIRYWYWPPVITVWHVEPGGKDSGEVCRHYRRDRQPDGSWKTKILHGWRWHVHHWRLQIHPLQALRRWALTRCAWCGRRQTRRDAVNVSHSWDGPRGRWWQGEPGLYHHDCSSIAAAHRICICKEPLCADTDRGGIPYGGCARCGRSRPFGRDDAWIARQRILAAVPEGQRDKAAYALVCEMYAAAAPVAAPDGGE